jgi:UDP:flavonoid glycosyltransferase YjiC (YdhE family)
MWAWSLPLRPHTGVPAPDDALPTGFEALPYPRTIALTLGTVFSSADGARDVLEAALHGLRRLEANVVVITGPGSDVDRLGEQPDHVLVTPYIPYALLLPRIDLLVSQGGAGGVFGALSHGLPQLLLPQGGDQFTNTEACIRAGVALALLPASVNAGKVADLAARLLTHELYARAAQHVRREIQQMPDPASLLQTLLNSD